MKCTNIASILLLLAASTSAFSDTLCSYAKLTPAATRFFAARSFNDSGLATVPTSVIFERQPDNNELVVAHTGRQFGIIKFDENITTGSSTLTFLDANRHEIARTAENVIPCSTGLCRYTTFSFFMGNKTGVMRVHHIPGSGVEYFFENQKASSTVLWHSELDEYMDWVKSSISNESDSTDIPSRSPRQSLSILLASDPVISPYLNSLTVTQNATNQLLLSGRTTYTIYNLIFDKALSAGITNLRPDVIIDSATQPRTMELPQSLRSCLR